MTQPAHATATSLHPAHRSLPLTRRTPASGEERRRTYSGTPCLWGFPSRHFTLPPSRGRRGSPGTARSGGSILPCPLREGLPGAARGCSAGPGRPPGRGGALAASPRPRGTAPGGCEERRGRAGRRGVGALTGRCPKDVTPPASCRDIGAAVAMPALPSAFPAVGFGLPASRGDP